jgi:hypothetical protein
MYTCLGLYKAVSRPHDIQSATPWEGSHKPCVIVSCSRVHRSKKKRSTESESPLRVFIFKRFFADAIMNCEVM